MAVRLMPDARTLVIGYNGALPDFTMSPLRIRPRGGVTRWVYSSLLRFDEDCRLEGDLAESFEVSRDGRSYLFHLRTDARWHDGTPVTADDVVYTADVLQQPHRYFRNTLLVAGEPATFKALDQSTVRVDLPVRQSTFPSYLTPVWGSLFLVLPSHLQPHLDETGFENAPVGTGPFRYEGVAPGGELILARNDDYFAGRPKIDRVVVRFFQRNDDRVAAFMSGELDVLLFPGRAFDDGAARRAGGRLYSTPTNTIVQFAMNCRSDLFGSTLVRQAIASAIDRRAMVREVEGPDGIPAFGPVGPMSDGFEPRLNEHPFDPARSRHLLEGEGWMLGEDGVRRRDGRPFEFTLIYPPDTWNFDLARYAGLIRRSLRDVGVFVTPRQVDYWSELKTAWRNQSFESFIYYDTFYVEPDLFWAYHSSLPRRPGGPDAPAGLPQYGYGVSGYESRAVDQLIESYRKATSREEQIGYVRAAQRILADDVASIWLFNYPWRNVVSDRVGGLSVPTLADGTSDLIVFLRPERLFLRPVGELERGGSPSVT